MVSELNQAISNNTASLVTAFTTSQSSSSALASRTTELASSQPSFCLTGLHLHEYFKQHLRLTHSVYA